RRHAFLLQPGAQSGADHDAVGGDHHAADDPRLLIQLLQDRLHTFTSSVPSRLKASSKRLGLNPSRAKAPSPLPSQSAQSNHQGEPSMTQLWSRPIPMRSVDPRTALDRAPTWAARPSSEKSALGRKCSCRTSPPLSKRKAPHTSASARSPCKTALAPS